MVEQFDSWIHSLGDLGFLVLGLAALIEYVFPPFPGDTILLLGGLYASRGEHPWPLVLAAVTAGSVVGASIDYAFGRYIAERVEKQPDGKLFLGVTHVRIHQMQEVMRRRGLVIIFLNRFIPAFRGLLFVAAGAARMSFFKVTAAGAVSALAWNLLLLGIGIAVGGNAESLERFFRTYHRAAWALVALVPLVFLLRYLWRRRKASKAAP